VNRHALYRHWRPVALIAALIAVAAVTSLVVTRRGDSDASTGAAITVSEQVRPNPLMGRRFYIDPQRKIMGALHDAQRHGRSSEVTAYNRIVSQPSAHWVTGGPADVAEVRRLSTAAAANGTTALIVLYAIPHRDACGKLSNGGLPTAESYLRWLLDIAHSISGPTTFIVEPDAIADLANNCLQGGEADKRSALLSDAVLLLKRQPKTTGVYLDAGNPDWFPDSSVLAKLLHTAGVHTADGIAVNVSNFVATDRTVAWSQRLVQALNETGGQLGVVIDTSRNGNGSYQGPGEDHWCNPPGRALGPVPATDTGLPNIDALAWIKVPGESDGDCGRGNPSAGAFWPAYALGLARGNSPS
jgi:endoglucanase